MSDDGNSLVRSFMIDSNKTSYMKDKKDRK